MYANEIALLVHCDSIFLSYLVCGNAKRNDEKNKKPTPGKSLYEKPVK